MRSLRIVTGVLAAIGIGTVLSYPITVGVPPSREESLAVRKGWAFRLATFTAVSSISFLGAAIGAVLIVRRVRQEFAEKSLMNLTELITAEVESHKAKETE